MLFLAGTSHSSLYAVNLDKGVYNVSLLCNLLEYWKKVAGDPQLVPLLYIN